MGNYILKSPDGKTEWNATVFCNVEKIRGLEVGKIYYPEELGVTWILKTQKDEKIPLHGRNM